MYKAGGCKAVWHGVLEPTAGKEVAKQMQCQCLSGLRAAFQCVCGGGTRHRVSDHEQCEEDVSRRVISSLAVRAQVA